MNSKDTDKYLLHHYNHDVEDILNKLNYYNEVVAVVNKEKLQLLWFNEYKTDYFLSMEIFRFMMDNTREYAICTKLYKEERLLFNRIVNRIKK